MSASADRNLLFGILAVQLDFVTRDQLIAAMNAWLLDKGKPLGDILRDQGHLSAEELQHLAALVEVHLKRHGNDPHRSLAALSSVPPTLKQQLAALPDEAVQQSIAYVGAVPPPTSDSDPNQTVAQPLPPPEAVRYRILRPHARGGLGEVFVAEDTELGRSVALKEIQDRYAHDTVSRERFVREAEITGGLEHPGIVPVYGLGSYADGRPFYAMRFVKGDNLKAAIRRFHNSDGSPPREQGNEKTLARAPGSFDSLEFRQLLRRFIDVCNAVAYAHSRGVLHRDLKPGNIMLGKYGETLVVDWGLAKPLGRSDPHTTDPDADATLMPRSGGDSSSATVAGQALGTPAYMSPEQAAGKWDELGPATDIYSLGATLYELLTGSVPFPELDLDAVQKGRFPLPRQVTPPVPPALQAVCLKAMAKRPADRYAAALDLARDVEHWLADEPVAAWREPWGVRAWRWVRRHRTLVTTAAGVVVAAAAGLGLLAVEREKARGAVATEQAATLKERDAKDLALQEAEAQRDAARRERDRALAARKRTREALDAMVSGATGDALTRQQELTPEQRKFLETVVGYYQEFAAEPGEDREGRVRLAQAHLQLGRIFSRFKQASQAVKNYGRAVELYDRLVSEFPDTPAHRRERSIALDQFGLELTALGQHVKAEAALRSALSDQGRLVSGNPRVPLHRRELAFTQSNLGVLLHRLGRHSEAEAAHRAALAARERLAADFPAVPEYRHDLASSHSNLGVLLSQRGRRSEAAAAFQAAVAVNDKLAAEYAAVPKYRASLALDNSNLGVELSNLGRKAEAEAAHRAALAARERLAADFPAVPEYRHDLASSHSNLGVLLSQRSRRSEAAAAYRAAAGLNEKLAAAFPTVLRYRQSLALSHSNLGFVLAELGKAAEAEAAHRAALAARERLAADFPAVPEYRHELAETHANLANLLARRGRPAEAEAAYRAAVKLREDLTVNVPGVPAYKARLATTLHNLGRLLSDLNRANEAEVVYRAALAHWEELAVAFPATPDYRSELAVTHENLGQRLRANGDRNAAADALKAALNVRESLARDYPAVPKYRDILATNYFNLGVFTASLGRHEEAETALRSALSIREKLASEYPSESRYSIEVGGAYCNLGNTAEEAGNLSAVLPWHTKAINHLAPMVQAKPDLVVARQFLINAYFGRARALTGLKRFAEALPDWDEALKTVDTEQRPTIQASRAACLAHLGRIDDAVSEAIKAAADPAADIAALVTSSRAMSLASAAPNTPAAYAARAVALLRAAVAKGYRNVVRIQDDPDLAPLRRRDDFAALLWDLADLPAAAPK